MMNLRFLRLILALLFLFTLSGVNAQFYTGSHQDFGKNRVQYKGFQWRYHNYTQFKVHYYVGGENFAVFAAQSANKHLNDLQKYINYGTSEKIDIIVFNKYTDFKMSNIGINDEESSNIGGAARIYGSKIFIYFDGRHDHFDQQIKSALAELLIYKKIYGENYREAFKNSTLFALPSWYIDGFISYVGEGWSTTADARVKDGILSRRFTQFNQLEGEDAKYAGLSFWNYIAERYGEKVIPQIIYTTQLNRNMEQGFLFILGINLNTLANDYIEYYQNRYRADNQKLQNITIDSLPIRNKRDAVYTQFSVSNDGRYAAYVTNQLGQYKVWVYDILKDKEKRIYKREYKLDRINDYTQPVIKWHPKFSALSYFTEDRGYLKLKIYTVEDGKTNTVLINQMDKVLDFSYNQEGNTIVFSGVKSGQTDLFLFNVAGRSKVQLTNDIYDDLNPVFVSGNKIIFSSNRMSDTLSNRMEREEYKPWESDFDIFLYDLDKPEERQILTQITDSPRANEFYPGQYKKEGYTYLSDKTGIFNRYIAARDSAIAYIDTAIHYRYFSKEFPLTNYNTNILQYESNIPAGLSSFMTFEDGLYKMYTIPMENDVLLRQEDLGLTNYKIASDSRLGLVPGQDADQVTIKIKKHESESSIDINHYKFEDDPPEFEEEVKRLDKANKVTLEAAKKEKKEEEKEEEFEIPGYVLYKTNFAIDEVVTQVDNNFLFRSYQRFTGSDGIYFNPGLSGLIKLGVSDLFEDHKVVGGFRIPVNFESGEYLLVYDHLPFRIDHKFVAYRNSFQIVNGNFDLQKIITHEFRYRMNYPIDVAQSVRFTLGYRNDQTITQALDQITLNTPDEFYNMISGKVEYVFDAVRPRGLNLYNGTRFKVFGEVYKELNDSKSNIFIVGADFRHYQKIHKDIIYAGRIAGSYSFGDKRVAYYLGAVDNWIFRTLGRLDQSFDASIQLPTNQEYAFQTLGTPMRGFIQNIRNGSNFAVINNEIRVPVVKYFSNKPIKSDFLENFMVIGFSDIGSAWTGSHPYSSENSFNTIIIDETIYHIELDNLKDPIVWGYGFGLRSKLLGYYVRFDWAWGVDDGTRQQSIRYLSLTLDF